VQLRLDRSVPLYEQLYRAIREQILSAQLPAAIQLASTRTLAIEWGVSRFTVMNAMDRLLAEGYLVARHGSGTFVVDTVPDTTMLIGPSADQAAVPAPEDECPGLSRRGQSLAAIVITGPRTSLNEARPFHPRRTPLDVFPLKRWTRIVRRQWLAGASGLDYSEPAGHPALREAIAAHISVTRAVRCTPRQVIVTSGSQQAFDLLFRLLLDPGDKAWIEEPGYLDVRAALVAAGASLVPVGVDAEGLDVAEGVRRAPDARIAVVSPSHQYPTGVTLSAARRASLLDWARRVGACIVEDDYDSYFRYSGHPMSALQGVDRGTAAAARTSPRVVYVGTFSKTMFPALRLGFCVVPEAMAAAVANARAIADRNSPTVDQAALAEFMTLGHYERHLRRVRAACQERYEALTFHCAKTIPQLTLAPISAGTHVVGKLCGARAQSSELSASTVSRMAAEENLVVFPLSRYCLSSRNDDEIVLGFGGVTPRRIAHGVSRLARVIDRARRVHAVSPSRPR
jgi:GntR family transcriptional regulator / MocR family aminotransferase